MKQNSDIDVLFTEINQHSDSYYEIVKDKAIQTAMGRWPLIVAINEGTPIKKVGASIKKLAAEPLNAIAPSQTPMNNGVLSETLTSVQSQLNKVELNAHMSQEKVTITMEKMEIQEVLRVISEDVEQPIQTMPVDDLIIDLSKKGELQSILAMASSHIKPATSQSIGSLFERLNRG